MVTGSLTVEDVVEKYPNRSIGLFRCERGPEKARHFVWVAQWDGGYFTSDTDRHAYFGNARQHFGETVGEALWKLVYQDLVDAQEAVIRAEQHLEASRKELTKVTKTITKKGKK